VKTYTIYHIPGKKVGCTVNFKRRKSEYPKGTQFEILEELHNEKEAADREWYWADHFGYKKGFYYSESRWDIVIPAEELSSNGKLGGSRLLPHKRDPSLRRRYGVGFENNSQYNGSKKHLEDAYRGALKAVENGNIGMKTTSTCPYCGHIGQTRIMGRWHFDNCKLNPNKNGPRVVQCVYCGMTGQTSNIRRWHNDNCKFRSVLE
jgi:hypothetical protein